MQEALYQTIQDLLQVLKAVTSELHHRHPEAMSEANEKGCPRESCRALSQAEAQVDELRRALGIPAFRR